MKFCRIFIFVVSRCHIWILMVSVWCHYYDTIKTTWYFAKVSTLTSGSRRLRWRGCSTKSAATASATTASWTVSIGCGSRCWIPTVTSTPTRWIACGARPVAITRRRCPNPVRAPSSSPSILPPPTSWATASAPISTAISNSTGAKEAVPVTSARPPSPASFPSQRSDKSLKNP